MTKPFSPKQKYRILVMHEALVLFGGSLVSIASVAYGTMSETRRFGLVRKWGYAVRCACGCGVWARHADIEFHHVKEHVNGGETAIWNGAPLRRQPCHARESARAAAVTGKVTRTKRKLSVTTVRNDSHDLELRARPRRSWPQRSLSHPTLKRRFSGEVVERCV